LPARTFSVRLLLDRVTRKTIPAVSSIHLPRDRGGRLPSEAKLVVGRLPGFHRPRERDFVTVIATACKPLVCVRHRMLFLERLDGCARIGRDISPITETMSLYRLPAIHAGHFSCASPNFPAFWLCEREFLRDRRRAAAVDSSGAQRGPARTGIIATKIAARSAPNGSCLFFSPPHVAQTLLRCWLGQDLIRTSFLASSARNFS